MEVPSTTWFSEALCTSLYKDSHSPTSANCMTTLDDDASYITNNYTDLSDACRNTMGHEDSKKYNSTHISNNSSSHSDNADSMNNNNNNNENNNYLMTQAKHARLVHSGIQSTQDEYIDLDKLYQSQRTLLSSSMSPSSSSTITQPTLPLQHSHSHHHNLNQHHSHNHNEHHSPIQHSLSHPPHNHSHSSQSSHPVIMKNSHRNQSHHHQVISHTVSHHHPLVVPPQGHSPSGASSIHQSRHHNHSVSSSTSPNSSSSLSHLHSDHNHQRHQHLPQQHSTHQQMDGHHPYSNYNTSSVFNGETSSLSSQGRDSYVPPSTENESNDYDPYPHQYSNYNGDHDTDSESEHQRESETQPTRKRPGRPRGSRRKKPEKLGRLWEFIRDLLLNNETCPSLICWDNYEEGMFRFVHSDKVAKLWGAKRDNPDMNYEKLSRAMRYYYKSKVLQPVFGRRLVYKFGPEAKGWRTENPNFRC